MVIFKAKNAHEAFSTRILEKVKAQCEKLLADPRDQSIQIQVTHIKKSRKQEMKFHAKLDELVKVGHFKYNDTNLYFDSTAWAKCLIIDWFDYWQASEGYPDIEKLVKERTNPITGRVWSIRETSTKLSSKEYSMLIEFLDSVAAEFEYIWQGQKVIGFRWPEYIEDYK